MKEKQTGWLPGLPVKIFRAGMAAICIVAAGKAVTFGQSAATPSSTNTSAPAAKAAAPPSAPAQLSDADLDKMVAPIAIYPDPLLATLLPASAYPLEVVQAARFVKDTNNIAKLDSQPWDDNVKAVARFPQVINQMNDNIQWTSDLGDAFINQPKAVTDAIQRMRTKAQGSGALKTTEQQVVTVTNTVVTNYVENNTVIVTNQVVQIQPSQPDVIYVPQYNPTVVYPSYPVAYPGYVYPPYYPVAGAAVSFGLGMAAGAIIANNCDWGHGGCWGGSYHGDVNVNRNVNRNSNRDVNRNTDRNRNTAADRSGNRNGGQKWQPDSNRRQSSGSTKSGAQSREARGYGSGSSANRSTAASQRTGTAANRSGTPSTRPGSSTPRASGGSQLSPTGPSGNRQSTPSASTRQSSPSASTRQSSPSASTRQSSPSASTRQSSPSASTRQSSPSGSRSASSQSSSRPSSSGSSGRSAFSGGGGRGGGSATRAASSRGSSSRGGGGGGGGGGGRR